MDLIRASNQEESKKILDFVHDRIFDLSEVNYDETNGIVTIPITVVLDEKIEKKDALIFHRWKNQVVVSNLIINQVTSIDIEDTDNIGQGCINNFTFSDSRIVINNSVPVKISMCVATFSITLEITDIVKEKKSGFSLGT